MRIGGRRLWLVLGEQQSWGQTEGEALKGGVGWGMTGKRGFLGKEQSVSEVVKEPVDSG